MADYFDDFDDVLTRHPPVSMLARREPTPDDCEMCDGQGEIDVPKVDEYGNVPCPDCVSRELNETIAELKATLRKIADGEVDDGGNRRNYQHATADARRVLGMPD